MMKKNYDINDCSTTAESEPMLKELTKKIPSNKVLKKSNKINKFKNWTQVDTNKFFRSIELFGTDFYMINYLFKDRTRTQLKRKYKKERDSQALNQALKKERNNKFIKLKMRLNLLDLEKIPQENKASFIRQRFDSLASVDSLDVELVEEIQMMEK